MRLVTLLLMVAGLYGTVYFSDLNSEVIISVVLFGVGCLLAGADI